jgi:tetratricopeptide (TPR) repeat protein
MRKLLAVLFTITLPIAVTAQPNDAPSLYRLGREALARGDSEKAIEYLEKAVALKDNSAEYHYQLANAYGAATMDAGMFKMMGLAKKLKSESDRAVQLDPNLLPARFMLMEFYLRAPGIAGGSESKAVEQATEIRKRDAIDGHRAFATIHTVAKKPELARKEFVDMVKEQPSSPRAHYYYGVYLMLTDKNYKAATDEFESALKLESTYMPAYFQIGHAAALAANNFARGEETLKKYLAYQPKDDEPPAARTYYWLGAIYEKQGRKADAKSSYAASLKINPKQKDVNEAMKRVS